MRSFLLVILLSGPWWAFATNDNFDPCGLKSKWVAFFEPAISKMQLLRQMEGRRSLEKEVGTMAAGAVRTEEQIVTYISTQYASEAEAIVARRLLRVVKQFKKDGMLGPFRLSEFQARLKGALFTEFVEGRILRELLQDEKLDSERRQQVSSRFQNGLQAVKAYAKDHRLKSWDIAEGEQGYGIGVEIDQDNQFVILSSKVIVTSETGEMVIIGLK